MIASVHRKCCNYFSLDNKWSPNCMGCDFLKDVRTEQKNNKIFIKIRQKISTYRESEAKSIRQKRDIIKKRKADIKSNEKEILESLKKELGEESMETVKYLACINEKHRKEIKKLEEGNEIIFNYERYGEEITIVTDFSSQIKIRDVVIQFITQEPLRLYSSKENITTLRGKTSNKVPIIFRRSYITFPDITEIKNS